MKYPQLVSTRAVNAISDWLVSRLEQLGVEAPQPYTRLLLSLLQSTIQLNDPIELSNLESFLASRKGGNRRYQTCDTDALKKFNAVQCLKEIVSSEQEITTIENLVDELCEKLKDIEKQTDDCEDEHKLFVATLNLAQQAQHHNSNHINSHHSHHKSHHNHQTKEITAHSKGININRGRAGGVGAAAAASGRLVGEAGGEGGGNTKQSPMQTTSAVAAATTTTTSGSSVNKSITEEEGDISELDPLDLYRRAFPALSKDMENSFVTYRRNVKWLTWPVEQHKRRDHATSISSCSSTISSNSDGGDAGGSKDLVNSSSSVKQSSISAAKDKKMIDNNTTENTSKLPRQDSFNMNENESALSVFGSTNSTIGGGIKRKTKRRRSRALSKSKGIQQNVRKTSIAATVSSATVSTSMQNNSNNGGGKNKRNASPAYWDTDFEGCWEMGRDLIKEFITRQNRNSRNRSTSESAVACNNKNTKMTDDDYKEKPPSKSKQQWQPTEMASISTTYNSDEDEKTKSFNDTAAETSLAVPPVVVDFSFCDYDDYDDTTLASVSEITNDDGLFPKLCTENDSSNNAAAMNHRAKRLYERELIPPNDLKSHEQLDFAQFEAKFNSSVEALWKDAGGDEEIKGFHSISEDNNKMRVLGYGHDSTATHFAGPTSLPCDIPFRQNLKNFWTNYYNHHFDLTKMLPASLNIIKPNEKNEMMMQLGKVNDNRIGDGTYDHQSKVGIQSRDAPEQMCNFANSQMDISSTTAPTSDYYSMPPISNLDSMNMNKAKLQRCGIRHNSCCSDSGGGTIGEERKTPVALFLQNSIWSDNANIDGGDTDESFLYKVYNSGKQLGNVTAGEQKLQCDTINSSSSTSCIHNNNNNSANGFILNAPYNASKWSEGINAGPSQQQQQHCGTLNQKLNINSGKNNNFNMPIKSMDCGTDCTDSSSTSSLAAAVLPSASIINNTNWQLLKSNNNNRQSAMQNAWSDVGVEQMRDITQQQQQQQQHLVTSCFHEREREHEHKREINAVASPKITLPNHSKTSSGFIAYSRIKSVLQFAKNDELTNNAASGSNITPMQHELQRNNYSLRGQGQKELQQQQQQKQHRYALDMLEEGENLLTSERTHFHPIKSYTDGHTFDICSELDVIEYQRSSSGYLYYEQEKYLEYMRSDNFMIEDDGSSGSTNATVIGASANPLYANSNCEAATATNNRNQQLHKNSSSSNNNSSNINSKSKRNDFVIKFRLQRTEIACQTDIVPPNIRSLIGASATANNNNRNNNGSKQRAMFGMNIKAAINQPHPLSVIFSNAAKNLKANAAANQFVYSDTVEAFTRAMAHFPPPTNTAANQSIWLPVGSNIGESQLTSSSTTSTLAASTSASANRNCWNVYQEHKNAKKYTKVNEDEYANDDTGYDEVDFYGGAGPDVINMSMCNRTIMTYMDTDVDMASNNFVEQEWSMNEIRRKCKEAGHMTLYTNASANAVSNNNNIKNNNNNNSNSDNIKNNATCSVVSGAASGGCVGNSSATDTAAADAGAFESVWGMCAACNSELKSIPANRLLRDELQLEADEIMSDLKYMQDLYIGRAGDGDDDDDDADADGNEDYNVDGDDRDDPDDIDCINDDDDESNVDTVTSDSDWCAEDLNAEAVTDGLCTTGVAITANQSTQLASVNANTKILATDNTDTNSVANNESDNLTVIQKVNRLIAELLRPENTITNGNGGGGNNIFHMSKLKAANSEERPSRSHAAATIDSAPPPTITEAAKTAAQFSGNLWHTNNNERNIWKLTSVDSSGSCSTGIQFGSDISLGKLISGGGTNMGGSSSIYPIQLLRQINIKPIDESMTSNADSNNSFPLPAANEVADIYRTQINWKHENLAKIWQTSPPPAQPIAQQTEEPQQTLQLQEPQQHQHEVQQQKVPPLNEIMSIKKASDSVFEQSKSTEEVADIAEKNMRNLRANADASVAAAAANLQKAQEFLTRQGQQCKMALGGFTTGSQLLDSAFKLKAVTRKRRHSASQNYFHTQISVGDDEGAATTKANETPDAAIAGKNNNNNNKIADLNKHAMMESSNANATTKNTNITTNTTINNNNNNNNSDLIFQNLLNASLHSFGAAAAAAVAAASNAATKPNHQHNLCGTEDIAYDCDATAAAANKNHTIITCKYHLTTIEPMNRNINDGDNNNDVGIDDVGLFDDITMTAAAPLSCLIDKNSSILNHVTMMSRPLTR